MDLIYKRDKTQDDVNQLINKHHKLVYYMLHNMNLLDDQDAESAAFQALWDAVETFDVFSSVPFANYACTVLKNRLNDLLRERAAAKRNVFTLVEISSANTLFICDEIVSQDTAEIIHHHFDTYVNSPKIMHTVARSVLLVWFAADFEMNATNIAKICKTSPSYVSRVQCSFRAYLSKYL